MSLEFWALNFHSPGKIALGPLSFHVGEDGLLTPQPTDEQIGAYALQGYLKRIPGPVATGDSAPAPEPLPDSFELKVNRSETVASLPPPVSEDDDILFEEPPPVEKKTTRKK